MTAMPTPHEARQLLRLRGLRVGRARERCTAAQAAVEAAAATVHERQRTIERLRQAIDALQQAVVGTLAPELPRWSKLVGAQRDHLADQLERAEYALVQDEHKLEQAQEALQQARAELTRALAREDTVRGLAQASRRALLGAREQRAELELEDLRARGAAAR